MNGSSTESSGFTRTRLRTTVQIVGGVALIGYGIARLTDAIAWELPAAVHFAAGIALLAYGVWLARE